MRILAIANVIPMRDRSGGWYRFFALLRLLARKHQVYFHPLDLEWQYEYYGKDDIDSYREDLEAAGVRILIGNRHDVRRFLRTDQLDIVFFEHYGSVRDLTNYVRFWQPRARIVVDTIDVEFNRLLTRASITQKLDDLQNAQQTKATELSVYSRADIVIAISETERALLLKENCRLRVGLIPLIVSSRASPKNRSPTGRSILFVAHFDHDANVDGIVHFCSRVLPLVRRELPDVRLRIIGHSPPEEVKRLAGPGVEVLGYVPDIATAYESTDVAIAPMRFGGGLKGKIAEAMSYGLPVVTNNACLVGFDLSPNKDVLVGDSPEEFAGAIVKVLLDQDLYRNVSANALGYIATHFSDEVVAQMLEDLLQRSMECRPKRLSWRIWAHWKTKLLLDRHVLWRFHTSS
jgi:O-antigen biosynthesis protein